MKSIRLFSLVSALLLVASTLSAQVTLSITFSPVLASGDDPEGFGSSTWTMSFELPETYTAASILAAATVSTGTLTVAGSASLDGTYTITGQSGDFAFYPNTADNSAGGVLFAFNPFIQTNSFSFAGVDVTGFAARGDTVLDFRPSSGSSVEASHFQGASVSSSVVSTFTVTSGVNSAQLSFGSVPISVSVVPEAGTYAAVVGWWALGFAVTRRTLRRSRSFYASSLA